jgi:hypothetical protein
VTGYETAGWGDLLACAGGAAAVLAGLIFVGLSVNMSTLLELDKQRGQNFLTGRALEAFVAMLLVLVICVVALTPHVVRGLLAAFILAAAGSAISPVRALRFANRQERRSPPLLQRVGFAFAFTVCLLVCGITLAAAHGGGLFWLPAAFVIAIAVTATNSWVLR